MDAFTGQEFKDANGNDPSLTILDSQGNPAQVDGPPTWGSSDDTVLSVTPAADGMSAAIRTVAPGTARVSGQADKIVGEGVEFLTFVSEDIVVTQNPNTQAAVITLNLGTPQDL